MFDILVAGEINPDLVLSGDVVPEFGQVEKLIDSDELTVGSSSAIFACSASRLGMKVAFIGVCGEDLFGRFMLDELMWRGVDISHVITISKKKTGISVILNRGNGRSILTFPGLIPALRSEQVADDLLRQARHQHIASYFLQKALRPGLPELFTRAHTLGLSTSLDPNWDPAGAWQGFDELLGLVDVFLPNENEALAITKEATLDVALAQLGQCCPVVAVKCGSHGGKAIQAGALVSASALRVNVVDTVWAGDNFDAGFLYGWLKGWELDRSLKMAVACGSLSTRKAGGVAAQPTYEEALAYGSPVG